jgi:RNA polymerase sigma factor (sigma-70 family)
MWQVGRRRRSHGLEADSAANLIAGWRQWLRVHNSREMRHRPGQPATILTPMDRDEADVAVVRQLADGRDAFLAYLRRRLDDPELAEDLLQDSLLRAIRAAPELRDDERLLAWFYRLLHNAAVDAYRRRGVRSERMPTVDLATAGDIVAPAAEADPVACACFRALLPSLKPEYADLIEHLDLGAETPDQAAARLGITSNNLKVRHHRARQALRHRLEQTCRTCAAHHCLDCTCQAARL